jgi:N-acetylmuramic acid 6-phosphate etherase
MVRLGAVRGNLMIDVQATNAKLRDRAIRLVAEVLGCSREEAQARLQKANWNVRAAVD